MPLTVGLFYNFKPDTAPEGFASDFFAEFDSQQTIDAIEGALESAGHKVVHFEAVAEKLLANIDEMKGIDIAFNLSEGVCGESRESHIPAILEMLEIPYTGSGVLTLALTLDKAAAKKVLIHHGIATPRFQIFSSPNSIIPKRSLKLKFPLIVKPVGEGSSKGVLDESVVRDKNALKTQVRRVVREYSQPAIVEEFLTGREFTVALLGNNPPQVLPIVEIDFGTLPQGANPAYSYESKWIWDVPESPLEIFSCPAKLSQSLEKKIKRIAIEAFNATGCRDWCRIDVRMDAENKEPQVLELNPIPGIMPDPKENSCFPKASRAADISYEEMVNAVLFSAMKRHGARFSEELARPYYKRIARKLGKRSK